MRCSSRLPVVGNRSSGMPYVRRIAFLSVPLPLPRVVLVVREPVDLDEQVGFVGHAVVDDEVDRRPIPDEGRLLRGEPIEIGKQAPQADIADEIADVPAGRQHLVPCSPGACRAW